MNEKREKIISIAEALQEKTPLRGRLLYSMSGKWIKRFGYELCDEVISKISNIRSNEYCIQIIEKSLQEETVKKNHAKYSVLDDLTSLMGR